MKLATFKQFKKIMSLTTSDNDHEALSALRAANALLKAEGIDWVRVLDRSINVIQEVEAAPDEPLDRRTPRQWELDQSLLVEAQNKMASMHNLSRRSRNFIESICEQFEEKGFITDGQRESIKGFVE